MVEQTYIVGAKRTAIGSFQGCFSGVPSTQLAATAISAALQQSNVPAESVQEAYIGCVLTAGLGQAPARQAVLGAGMPVTVGCTTVNKVCGSGMKTVMLGADAIGNGMIDVILAGGMESMTMAPYIIPKARGGYRMGHAQILDHMFFDGLQNPYDNNMMGFFAEKCADKYAFTREQQDAFSKESVQRAMKAIESGWFVDEIAPVKVVGRKTEQVIDQDEEPSKCNIEKIPHLKPAFRKENGTVTAANASKISDGASMTLLASESAIKKHKLKPIAKILGYTQHSDTPEWFTTAPVGAIKKLIKSLNLSIEDIDLFEINEAFSVVTMAAMKELEIPHSKVNIHGGATALGHPIGASGNRVLVTLIYALKRLGLKRGVASLCIGGGEATAIAIELC